MSDTKDKASHHHGNLRQALIEAGIELLTEGGLDALTLRKCAARAGVSHAAPAHHFDGIDGLRVAIAQEGFVRFRHRMLDFADAGPQTPRGRLHGICKGYLAFAREEPALYDLIFSFRAHSKKITDMRESSTPSYQVLRDACAPFVPPGTDPLIIETQVWSLVHGFALLILTGRFGPGPAPEDAVLALLDRIGTPPEPDR
ncbi:MAG: TetR/AcrR family transcriptional regulator [Marinovum algicola]|jgi:AcrR family transcriptional regulator|uniref:Transcriptional regulator, TetR family n=1 Tax=Marinovum algicola TaxID=42444 RepID=A0A975ZPG0_9RHOB|nr:MULTISPECIES: TetR/AcrR family transcriptional regulator [Marinovum]AKO95358.1 Transcriptional regulator [Marinovum algicola DG 898]MDD9742310.1 TetR/AcrR family transcriptional regulator [Marinovum sp. SP66]MDD9746484.1 TetR/AcrR family transcriptional regulator [Marinovum sp. PR37]SEJ86743.1 transcriptional regulator, TetR family [Marinovum algicola]SLN67236.1 transcriptional regulator BetI [Marinovum algicola]